MHFTQYYLDCLSQASYLIGDETTGRAVVVDPRRDVAEYIDDAARLGLTIEGVLVTHFHADFVSGHLELAKETGAWLGFGSAAQAEYEIRPFADRERYSLGEVDLEIWHTPGHTPESISVLVREHAHDETPFGVLTGDALFIGDVGRPDLLASIGVTKEELGRMLYHSVHHRLMSLPDEVRLFPAHGAGSACGKNLSTEKQSTIGEQRRTNYACQPMTQEAFLEVVTEGQPAAPGYFVYNATINRQGRETLDVDSSIPALSPVAFAEAVAAGAKIHDARGNTDFATAHLAGAINVPADGRMAETVGMVFEPHEKVVVIADDGHEQEVATRFARIGYDEVVGYLSDHDGYFLAHEDQVRHASRLTAEQFDEAVRSVDGLQIVDIRNDGELSSGLIEGSVHIPLAQLAQRSGELDPQRPTVLYCSGGWRSSVGSSLLRSQGFADVSDVLGGFGAWAFAHGIEAPGCESTNRILEPTETSLPVSLI